jgi:hypothetical protein
MTLDSTVHVLNVYYQPLPDKIYKSQPTLIPNLFEGTVFVVHVDLIWSGFFIPETKKYQQNQKSLFYIGWSDKFSTVGNLFSVYLFELKYFSLALVVFEEITKSVFFCDFTI